MRRIAVVFALVPLLTQCSIYSTQPDYRALCRYPERQEIRNSLFAADEKVISNEAIQTLLDSKIARPKGERIATLRFGQADNNTELVKFTPMNQDTTRGGFWEPLQACPRVASVTPRPSMLVPYSTVTTEFVVITQASQEANLDETTRRAEMEATTQAMNTIANESANFLNKVP